MRKQTLDNKDRSMKDKLVLTNKGTPMQQGSIRSAARKRGYGKTHIILPMRCADINADCALLNSGTLRSDTLHPEGKFILRVNTLLITLDLWQC